ncbi:DUF500-domain-containing protein [Aspergillus sclerotioniger CBS 115572]|uniref:DUF500-domain-containing protein n=1 Tax=Aspergillus sclerotioniger CBS 115572 TaxID=1450535 RepID=A0A317VAS1_9EURO|nr:DUF500-domain-containing protein [Aspergillus sclerotioniger CBS 115572]PWY69010.1 DUF500-domain-containing protein [Aspergillus sclerotioniger CBS 115572]
MPGGIHNPFPSSLQSECDKAAQIIESFTNPDAFNSPGHTIPRKILTGAKGLAILTVAKVAFLGSGRIGSGVLVARLKDGSWSAPSAIMSLGGGFGGQIGVELTDFVFILQNDLAVRTFAQLGSLTLGINVSLALGTLGRNGEIASGVSAGGVIGMFSYAQTKGLFGGVSAELSLLVESRLANRKLYGNKAKAPELLGGEIPPPEEASALMRALQSDVFNDTGVELSRGLASEEPPAEVTIAIPSELPSEVVSERAVELPSEAPSEAQGATSSQPTPIRMPSVSDVINTPPELPGSIQELDATPVQPRSSDQHDPVCAPPSSANRVE